MKHNATRSMGIGSMRDFFVSSGAKVSGIHAAEQVKEQLSLGAKQRLAEFGERVKQFPGIEHAEPDKVSLAPDEKADGICQFTKSCSVDFPTFAKATMRSA